MDHGTGSNVFQCGECDLTFSDPGQLANHMKCHMEVILIQCSGCTKYFLDPTHSTDSFFCTSCKNNNLVWNQAEPGNLKLENPITVNVEVVEHNKNMDYLGDGFCDDVDSYSSLHESESESIPVSASNNLYTVSFMKFVAETGVPGEQANLQQVNVVDTAPTESPTVDTSALHDHDDTEIKTVKKKKRPSRKQSVISQNRPSPEAQTVPQLETDSSKISEDTSSSTYHFGCGVCRTKFQNYESLKEHLRRHDSKPVKPFVCGVCDYSCKLATDLKRHLNKHTGAKDHVCKVCGKTFAVSQALSRHMKMHDGVKPHTCTVCDKAFTERSKLKIHMRTHSGEKPYECAQCHKKFSNLTSRNVHLRVHTGERPYICKRCGKAFYQASGLREHEKLHLSEKPHKCNYCGRGFSQLRPFMNHKRTHTDERPFKCSKCGRGFASHQTLYYHKKHHDTLRQTLKICDSEMVKKLIEEDENKKCKYCWKKFENPEDLDNHNLIHGGENRFYCEMCGERFHSMGMYRKHLRKHFQCFMCGERLSSSAELTKHKSKHLLHCKICDKGFRNSNQLTDHYRVHTREKPFQCATCGKTFRLRSSLSSHQIIHTNIVAYMCEICGKSLRCKTTLNSHRRTHFKHDIKHENESQTDTVTVKS